MSEGSLLETLPEELLVNEILFRWTKLSRAPDTLFVLRCLNRFFHNLLFDIHFAYNPLIGFCGESGSLELVLWDQEGPYPSRIDPTRCAEAAAGANQIDILRYLASKEVKGTERAIELSIEKASMEAITILVGLMEAPVSTNVIAEAAAVLPPPPPSSRFRVNPSKVSKFISFISFFVEREHRNGEVLPGEESYD